MESVDKLPTTTMYLMLWMGHTKQTQLDKHRYLKQTALDKQ